MAAIDYFSELFQFKDQAVRDLAWSIFSPSLIRSWQAMALPVIEDDFLVRDFDAYWQWLLKLEHDPCDLHRWLEARFSRRLGLYFEALVSYWLHHFPSFQVVKEHLPIYQGKQTIGELDVVFEHEQQLFHWELAVKYYLKAPSQNTLSGYIGPGGRDRLDLKVEHLAHHQLPLVQSLEAQAILQNSNIQSYAFMKGYLFLHLDEQQVVVPPPISDNFASGSWAYDCEWRQMHYDAQSRWRVLPRLEWLSPCQMNTAYQSQLHTWDSVNALLFEHFSVNNAAQLVVQMEQNPKTGTFQESHRIFIVPDSWPQMNTDFAII